MALLPIVRYPDPSLSTVCEPVETFDADLQQMADDLLTTIRSAPGVGITAAHVGVWRRIVVLELPDWPAPRTYVNPQILQFSADTMRHAEGSVSMPGIVEEVERPSSISCRYQDLTGAWHEERAEGFHAVCLQHEIDQLDGIFWLKRLSRLKRERLIRKWQKQGGG